MSILPAPSHPRQEAPKEQMHPIAQDSEEQPRYRVLLAFRQRPEVCRPPHPSLGFRLPPTPKHSDSHFKHRHEDFCLLMRHKGSDTGSKRSSHGNNWHRWPSLAQACLQSPRSSAREPCFTGVWPPEAPSSVKGKWVAEGLGFEGRFKEEPHRPGFWRLS